MNIISKVKKFVEDECKKPTSKYGYEPFTFHFVPMVRHAKELADKLGGDKEVIVLAAWLHDIIEDTSITFQEVFYEFGRHVARIVFACTDEPGKNRRERHERTYPKLMAAGRDAIAVKLADRIANMEHSLQYNHGMFKMYQKEYPEFKKALHLPGELKEMWAALDVLMQHRLEPEKK